MPIGRKVVGTVALVAIWPGEASGQTIGGLVRDAESDRPIQSAAVVLTMPANDTEFAVLTDDAGVFRFPSPIPGQYRVRVEASGYQPLEIDPFSLAQFDSIRLDIRLEVSPIELPEIVARGMNANREGFERRRDLSYGTRIGPAELAQRGSMPLSEFAAQRTPWLSWDDFGGLSTRNPYRYGSGCGGRNLLLFIDGEYFPLVAGIELDLDRWVPVERVQAIEVYPDGSTLPSPFFGLARSATFGRRPCAVIAVWTVDGFSVE